MVEDEDIKKLRRVLQHNNGKDLSDLLIYSRSKLNNNDAYSTNTTFEIYSSLQLHYKLEKLSQEDKKEIYDAILKVYPVKNYEIEITNIEYFIDFGIEDINLINVTELNKISIEYIEEQIKKCKIKIFEEDFSGAVTHARTLIESICLLILEEKTNQEEKYDGDLIKLHKEVAKVLKMSPGDYEDKNLKQILSGIFSIINGISGLRNNYSDAHGIPPSKAQYKIDKRHAVLTVNLAKSIAEYLYLTYTKS